MKRIAIVTLGVYYNLGNRLQNYALHRVLTELGFQVDSLVLEKWENIEASQHLRAFSDRYLNEPKLDLTDSRTVKSLDQTYDYAIAGSDQIWNCNFGIVAQDLPLYFLQYFQPNKRLSYAASFGVRQLPPEFRKAYIQGLSGMAVLSVREQAGADIIRDTIGRRAEVHIDPTLLLRAEDYRKLARPHRERPDGPYIVTNFLRRIPDEQVREIMEFASARQLEVVDISALLAKDKIGVEEFLDYLDHAACVVTNSFHCTVFSILLHRQFITYTSGAADMASRLDTLLQLLHLEQRHYQGPESLTETMDQPYDSGEAVLSRERARSISYLRGILGLPSTERADIVPVKDRCYGCTACRSVCPVDCIAMERDQEGFLYPHIDPAACIHCDRCREVCPALHPMEAEGESQAVAACHLDGEIRHQSTSGGAFTALARCILEDGGVVFGAAFDENLRVVHRPAETMEELAAFRGSKYVQSDLGDSYRQVRQLLEEGRKVLFSGTPCQVAGLLASLGRSWENLTTVDLICHGAPSPLAWEHYLDYCGRRAGDSVIGVRFRDKCSGWRNSTMKLTYGPGAVEADEEGIFGQNPFIRDFLGDYSLRRSCYHCGYRSAHRVSDLTLGDFWGVERCIPHIQDDLGTSLVLIHSRKGSGLLERAGAWLHMEPVELDEALRWNPSALASEERPARREQYFRTMREEKRRVW